MRTATSVRRSRKGAISQDSGTPAKPIDTNILPKTQLRYKLSAPESDIPTIGQSWWWRGGNSQVPLRDLFTCRVCSQRFDLNLPRFQCQECVHYVLCHKCYIDQYSVSYHNGVEPGHRAKRKEDGREEPHPIAHEFAPIVPHRTPLTHSIPHRRWASFYVLSKEFTYVPSPLFRILYRSVFAYLNDYVYPYNTDTIGPEKLIASWLFWCPQEELEDLLQDMKVYVPPTKPRVKEDNQDDIDPQTSAPEESVDWTSFATDWQTLYQELNVEYTTTPSISPLPPSPFSPRPTPTLTTSGLLIPTTTTTAFKTTKNIPYQTLNGYIQFMFIMAMRDPDFAYIYVIETLRFLPKRYLGLLPLGLPGRDVLPRDGVYWPDKWVGGGGGGGGEGGGLRKGMLSMLWFSD